MKDRIYSSLPVNKTAALVVSKGVNYDPIMGIGALEYDHPLPVVKLKNGYPNLVGIKYGKITVLGLCKKIGNGQKGKWLARCDCGKYVTRSAKAIRNASQNDACLECQHLVRLKLWEHYRRTGKFINDPGYF